MRTRRVSDAFDVLRDDDHKSRVETSLRGATLLRTALLNKGTGFTTEERRALGLEGLLPPAVNTLEQQVARAYAGYRRLHDALERYSYLRAVQERYEVLFYALLRDHLEEMLPIVYTPTVGEAVQQFDALYREPRGLTFSVRNIDHAAEVAANTQLNDVRMIVATDSSAILGIGDQGYGGLAIAIGKLALYTVGGGVSPFHSLPVSLDVGTERSDLVSDPFYLGVRSRRLFGVDYFEFMDRCVEAIHARWPAAVIQWEDLAKDRAFEVLARYRDVLPSFNDDIQGTGAVALAGVLNACRVKGESLADQTVLVHGAGAGGIGVAAAIVEGMISGGLDAADARGRVLVMDSRGLLVEGRPMEDYKAPFAQPRSRVAGWVSTGVAPGLHEVARRAGVTVLLGLSGRPGAFDEALVKIVASHTARPIIFPLSNPTASSEATPEDLVRWTDGRALIATGSPFAPVKHGGGEIQIGQGNNAFIFPGLGLGAVLCEATKITDAMVFAASSALAEYTARVHGAAGRLYPPVTELDQVSKVVAAAVIRQAVDEGVGRLLEGHEDIDALIARNFWRPSYEPTRAV